jgi:hypothetical protein
MKGVLWQELLQLKIQLKIIITKTKLEFTLPLNHLWVVGNLTTLFNCIMLYSVSSDFMSTLQDLTSDIFPKFTVM